MLMLLHVSSVYTFTIYFTWRSISIIKLLARKAAQWYSYHRQWGCRSCLIVGCGDLTILLVGLGFHCFLLKCKEKLRHSLGRPSRSDFVQLEVVTMFITYLYTFVNNGIIVSKSPLSVNFHNFRYFQTTIRKLFPKLKCHYW